MAASPRVFNLTVSNVPGPRFPLYMLGAELQRGLSRRPVAEGHALSIGMFSYRDHMFFGLYSDPEALPDATGFRRCWTERSSRWRGDAPLTRLVHRAASPLPASGAPYGRTGTNSSRSCFAASTMLRSEGSTSS